MFDQIPEVSETLEWMFRSRQVGDRTLVRNLVREQYTAVLRFFQALTDTKDVSRGKYTAEGVLLDAVANAQQFPGDMRVQVWLFKKVFQAAQKTGVKIIQNIPDRRVDPAVPGSGWNNAEIVVWLDTLPLEKRTAVVLHCLFKFNPYDISRVVAVAESKVAGMLAELGLRQLQVTGGSLGPGEIEEQICTALEERWPPVSLDKNSENQAADRIIRGLQGKAHRKQRTVLVIESVLVVITLILVVGMSKLINLLTPEPTAVIVYRTRVVEQVVYISPTPGPTQPATPFPDKAILYQAVGGETLAEIAQDISLDALILSALNSIPIDQPLARRQRVMIGISDSREIMPTLASSLPTPMHPQPPGRRLSLESSEAEILDHMSSAEDYWKSLWADALVVRYGPPGYVGEPEYRRQQIWIDQPYFNFVLDGMNGGEVELIYSVIGGWENLLQTATGELLSSVGPQTLNYQPALHQMLHNENLETGIPGEYELLMLDEVAGREVLVLDWYTGSAEERPQEGQGSQFLGRFWIDTQYGLILRVQKYAGISTEHIFEEIMISSIQFNVPIPRRLFDRAEIAQLYFASNFRGDYTHQPIQIPDSMRIAPREPGDTAFQTLPEGYELNQSLLEIHWTNLVRFNPGGKTTADIFADGYYLGNVEFAEPEQLRCARSADGYWIAFSSWSHENENGTPQIGWIDLRQLPDVYYLDPQILPYDFDFSPDSQQLAVYGCPRQEERSCGIYIVDLQTGAERLLKTVEQGAELIWSPDGESIAIQGSFLRNGRWRLLVINAHSGSVVYDGPFDWEGFRVSPDSPIHDWGVQYPPVRGGLELCTLPPDAE